MYNRYIRRDDGTYTKVAEPEPPRQETADHGSQPPPPPPDGPTESSPRSGGPPPSFGGTEGLAGYLRRILDQLHLDRVDAGDLLLLGLLYFLFREKADEDGFEVACRYFYERFLGFECRVQLYQTVQIFGLVSGKLPGDENR